jgi:hypothetical protein
VCSSDLSPEAAPQIAGAIAQAAIEAGASPETIAEITKAAIAASPEAAPQIAGGVAQAAIKAGASPETIAEITKAAIAASPEAAPQIAGAIAQAAIEAGALPETIAVIAQAAVIATSQAAPDGVPQVVANLADVLIANLSPGQLPLPLASLLENLEELPKEMVAQIAAALLARIPALPAQVQAEVRQAIEGVIGASGTGFTHAVSTPQHPGVSKDTLEKGGEQAAFEAAQVQGPALQAEIQTGPVESPRAQKEIPENILKLISETVSRIEIGETQTTITLQKTPDLPGDTTLEVRMENGRLEVVINATDPQTAQLLQSNIAALQSALAAGGGATQVSVSIEGVESPAESEDTSDEVGETHETSQPGGDKKVESKQGSGGAAS